MKYLFSIIKSNLYKLSHTKQLWIHLLMPILGIAVFCGYFSYSPWSELDKIFVFIQAVAMAFPLAASIVITMFYEEEQKAGNFQNILTLPCSKTIPHLSNLISLCIFGLIACICAVVGFGIVFRTMRFNILSILIFFKLSIVLFAANIALYTLQYIICFTFGKGISLGLGIVGTLLCPLLYLGLGETIWKYIPFGYGIRLGTYYLFNFTDTQTYTNILQDFKSGIIISSIISISLIIVFCFWSNHWQGSKQSE